MSRVVGVDFRDSHVRVVVLRVGYRALELEAFAEEVLSSNESPADALRACLARLEAGAIDTLVVTLDGARCFIHQLSLPASAKKRLKELLPFELEALLPLEIDELAVEHAMLPQVGAGPSAEISLLAVAARLEDVQACIDRVREAVGRQPERVGCSATELSQLFYHLPSLSGSEPIAFIDLGFQHTDVCIQQKGVVLSARTISLGVEGFPNDAAACVARLRQTFSAFYASSGREVSRLILLGEGAQMAELPVFLSEKLGIATSLLPDLDIEGVAPSDAQRAAVFGRAMAAAIHGVRGKGFDLRRGELSFERGYEHVKERAPLFFGLMAAVFMSFLFSVWAESRALDRENEALTQSLAEITKVTFDVETGDPDEAEAELAKAKKGRREDPMPYLDGFGVAVALSETLSTDIVHDVEELELAKGKIKLRGLVSSAEEAQTVAKDFGAHRCINDAKVTKITQVVNSERARYVLEAMAACPEDASTKGKKGKKSKKGGSK